MNYDVGPHRPTTPMGESELCAAMIAKMDGADGKAPSSAQPRLPVSNPRSTQRLERKGRVLTAIAANGGAPISVLAKAANVLVPSTAVYVRELTEARLITSDIKPGLGMGTHKRICWITSEGREAMRLDVV